MTRRLVVIGNGMAATRLVQRLVERDPARFAITVVGDEPHPAYNRIQLSPLLAGEKTAAQIPLLPAEWYTRHGVCLRSGEAVDEVDIQQRRLRIAETWLPWDELVFATGSRPLSRRCRALIVRRLCPSAPWRTWNVFWRYPARRW